MNVIIRHIMEFARESRARKEPTLLAEVVEKSLILINEQLRLKNIRVDIDLQAGLMAQIDPSQLEQVFINLLSNARDAIRRGARRSGRANPCSVIRAITVRVRGGGLRQRYRNG